MFLVSQESRSFQIFFKMCLHFRGSREILENPKTFEKFEKAKNMIKIKNEFRCEKRK
ncbi:hypothetical protein Hanom_Chr09g00808561 [Helianthus anomalus]